MLTRCFRAAALASNGPAFSRMVRGFSTAKKDYYDILGLNRDASQEEIKTAYRNLAKRYHPDVNASGEAYEGDAEKFRLVVEAYQVLNVTESRTAYDLQNQSAPESIYRAQRMEQQRKYQARGKDGQPIKEGYAPGSYAESKRKFLADERKKFNVGPTGRYKGGVPQKGKGVARGASFDAPGSYHDPLLHNIKLNPDPDSQFVTSRDALAFKHYMMEEKYSLRKRWTWFQAKVDFDFWKLETYKEGYRWIRNLLILAFGISGIAQLMVQAENRSVLKQVEKLRGESNLRAGVTVNGRKIKEGETGIIKLV